MSDLTNSTNSINTTQVTQQAQTTGTQGNRPMLAHAVFEGGGVRGIAHVGAVSVAEELGYQWEHVAGTSAGAIIAALVAAGYSASEMNIERKHSVLLRANALYGCQG